MTNLLLQCLTCLVAVVAIQAYLPHVFTPVYYSSPIFTPAAFPHGFSHYPEIFPQEDTPVQSDGNDPKAQFELIGNEHPERISMVEDEQKNSTTSNETPNGINVPTKEDAVQIITNPGLFNPFLTPISFAQTVPVLPYFGASLLPGVPLESYNQNTTSNLPNVNVELPTPGVSSYSFVVKHINGPVDQSNLNISSSSINTVLNNTFQSNSTDESAISYQTLPIFRHLFPLPVLTPGLPQASVNISNTSNTISYHSTINHSYLPPNILPIVPVNIPTSTETFDKSESEYGNEEMLILKPEDEVEEPLEKKQSSNDEPSTISYGYSINHASLLPYFSKSYVNQVVIPGTSHTTNNVFSNSQSYTNEEKAVKNSDFKIHYSNFVSHPNIFYV